VSTDIPYDGWPAETELLPGDVTLHVRTGPAGPDAEPAVMVHGLGGSSLNWTALMGLVDDRLACRAPDLPGFGFSPPPHDGDYSIDGHARAVVTLIEADRRGPVHLFGNSMGGAVATVVAATRPDLVRTLTLISPALPDLVPGRWRSQVVTLATPGLGLLLAKQVAAVSPKRRIDGLIELCFADPSAVPPEWRAAAERDVVARQRLPYSADAMVRSTQGIARAFLTRGPESLWEQAARVTAPTLLLYGSKDRLVRAAAARRAGRVFRDRRVVVLPETGHVAQIEHPALVARLVREHVDRAAQDQLRA
jgi:pimeloyl-ACP methyl ester carboxylesterase